MRPAEFDTIFSLDPEIDLTKLTQEQFTDYLRDREDLDSIRHAFSASGPTVYTIREIPHRLWDVVEAGATDDERCKRAFMLGVKCVKNIYQPDGTRLGMWTGSRAQSVDGGQIEVMEDKDLRIFTPAEIQEIGGVAYRASFLGRRIKSCFRLPPICVHRLQEQADLFAVSSPISPATRSEEPSE